MQVPIQLLRIVSPMTIQPMGAHISFVQDVPRDLQYFPMIRDICVVEEVSKHLDIPFSEF